MKWNRTQKYLEAYGRKIPCSCDVRNFDNKRRKPDQVVYSIPKQKPYQPDIFPIGNWRVYKPEARDDPYKAPFFIPTNAYQLVQVWDVHNGRYVMATNETTIDHGYGLHHSTSPTTVGCIKIEKKDDLFFLVKQINADLDRGEVVTLEVTEWI